MLLIIQLIPEILSEVLSDSLHVLQNCEAARMLLCVVCGIVLHSIVGKVEFLWGCC